jgi:flavin reductase
MVRTPERSGRGGIASDFLAARQERFVPPVGVRQDEPNIRAQFIDGMSRAAFCVSVVTTDGPAGRAGVTISAMSSVSADGNSPTLLVCINHQSRTAAAILENRTFCVNVLRDDQADIADRFGGRVNHEDGDKFAGCSWVEDETRAPRLSEAVATFDCRLLSAERIGTHHVYIGAVEQVTTGSGTALVYADRAYRTTQPLSGGSMIHNRIRKFNTKDTYPEQRLDNDLCQVVVAKGSLVFVRGQVGQDLDTSSSVAIGDPVGQTDQAMTNIKTLLEEAGAKLDHICKITIYITDPRFREPVYRKVGEYLKGVFPVSTGLVVSALARPEWLVEIDATAVIPEAP